MPCNDYRKFVEIQILIEQFSVGVVSVDSSHGFEVDCVCNTKGVIASDAHIMALISGEYVVLKQAYM